MIISAAQTTNERVRGVYRFGSLENAADKGCVNNWKHAFCSEWISSRLPRDFSEHVICSYEHAESVWVGESPIESAASARPEEEQTAKASPDPEDLQ